MPKRSASRTIVKRTYAKGALRPTGYLAVEEWALDQMAHGLKQMRCAECQHWLFSQEFDGLCANHYAITPEDSENYYAWLTTTAWRLADKLMILRAQEGQR